MRFFLYINSVFHATLFTCHVQTIYAFIFKIIPLAIMPNYSNVNSHTEPTTTTIRFLTSIFHLLAGATMHGAAEQLSIFPFSFVMPCCRVMPRNIIQVLIHFATLV